LRQDGFFKLGCNEVSTPFTRSHAVRCLRSALSRGTVSSSFAIRARGDAFFMPGCGAVSTLFPVPAHCDALVVGGADPQRGAV